MRKFFIEHPEKKLSIALSGAFIVILSSLKIPSVTGTSSHPTGTGLSVMLSGPWITVILCTIVLLFQGTFMAHGGFTTLGANVFSMGIAGPFAAYFLFKFLQKKNVNPTATVFSVVFTANFVTYVVTALQLTLIVPYTGIGDLISTYATFFGIFAATQIPIGIAEGVLFIIFFQYLADIRPDLVKGIGYDTSVRQSKSLLQGGTKENSISKKTRARVLFVCFAAVSAVLMAVAYFTSFFRNIGGSDDAGSGALEDLIPGFTRWIENFIQVGEENLTILFLIQTIIGVLILWGVIRLLKKKKHNDGPSKEHGSEFNSVDTVAYKSPMLRWSPLAKLFLIFSLLVLGIASNTIWMPLLTLAVGTALFLYASRLRPPVILMKVFVYAQVLIIISAVIFTIVIPGESIASIWIGITINFTDAGAAFGLLIYIRATAALLLLYAFAVSTPVPHLAHALKKLRLPDVFIEMLVLIYRYTFLLLETAEKMHLAAECKFGYSGSRKKMSTTARLAVGVFMRSLDTAEKGQIALQCRNYRGDFLTLSSFEEKSGAATVFCVAVVFAAAVFFVVLQQGVLVIVL
jgi:cobalamin biosynthesis protein CbiM/cobalt ECF transporter T component CbiQ